MKVKEADSVRMQREWDQRTARNAFHYIDTGRKEWSDPDEFFRTGDDLVERVADPFIRTHVKDPGACVALDIGCGAGRLTRALSKRFKFVHGVDVSGKMIDLARSLHADSANVAFHQTDGETLGAVESSSVDYVLSLVTFQHMPSERIVESNVREIARVLKPGGALQLDFPVLVGWYRLFGTVPVPRALKQYVPRPLLRIYRSWAIADPLKRTATFRGVTFTKHKAARLFSRHRLECAFQSHLSSALKLMVVGTKGA